MVLPKANALRPAVGVGLTVAGLMVLSCAAAAAAALTDAGVSIDNEGWFLDSAPDSAFLTRTTFYEGNGLLTEAGASFGVVPLMYAVVTAGPGRWGQAVASLSDTITFSSPQSEWITVTSNVAGYWNGSSRGGAQPVSRVEVAMALGSQSPVIAYTYPAGSANIGGVFTYDVDPDGPDWTPTTVQTGSYALAHAWSVRTNEAYRFSFSVLAVAADTGHAEIHDPLWFDLPDGVTLSSASGALYLAPVPEPQSGILFASGLLLGVAAVARARARRQSRA